jgi:glycosyltransferase involved in cell wall biosynthesis
MRYFKGKIPVLFRGDSTLLDEKFSMKQLVRRFFLRWVYQFVDKALYTGSANRAYFLAHGIVNQQLLFAGHAIDNLRFSATVESKLAGSKLREKLNIPQEAVLFLFAGKLETKKNPRLLLEAFLESHLPSAHLLITGNGMLEKQLKLEFLQQENIHFLDFQNQSAMPSVYCAADVFVLPSSGPGETWGLAINEAMAAGLAIICSNKVGASSDLVNYGINGYVFPSGDKEALVKLLKLINFKTIVAQMGKESETIISLWNHEKVAAAIEGALQN